jgi:hypothetical protein
LTGLPQPEGGSHPPRFYEWHDREKLLPQHNPDLPYPQGREGRYIRFTNQVCCAFLYLFFPRNYCGDAGRGTDFGRSSERRCRLGKLLAGNPIKRPPRVPFQANVGLLPALAHLSSLILGRYVFDNYTWDKSPGDFSSFNGKTITARVPLTALLSGALHIPRIYAQRAPS